MGSRYRVVQRCALGALVFLAAGCGGAKKGTPEIIVLCGASMRDPVEAVIKHYNEKHPEVQVISSYGGSGELMAQLRQTRKGDIYVCHDPFMEWGAEKGLISDWTTVGYLDVVIVVPKGNPRNIQTVEDLGREGLRIGLGDQRYSTSGVMATRILANVSNGDAIRKNVRMETKGHQQRATDILLGNLDATIIWNAVARLYLDKLDTISIPKDLIDAVTSATYGLSDLKKIKVTIGVTKYATNKPHVQKFFAFIRDSSPVLFAENGFTSKDRYGDNETK